MDVEARAREPALHDRRRDRRGRGVSLDLPDAGARQLDRADTRVAAGDGRRHGGQPGGLRVQPGQPLHHRQPQERRPDARRAADHGQGGRPGRGGRDDRVLGDDRGRDPHGHADHCRAGARGGRCVRSGGRRSVARLPGDAGAGGARSGDGGLDDRGRQRRGGRRTIRRARARSPSRPARPRRRSRSRCSTTTSTRARRR